MISTPQCYYCKHYNRSSPAGSRSCTAFSHGIPREIFFNKVSHTTHYPGDHGIRFEKLEDQELVSA